MGLTVGALQFERAGNFKQNVEKAKRFLTDGAPDFLLLGGEFAVNESVNTDPYPALSDLAKSLGCHIVAPVNANRRRHPSLRKGYASMHIFDRTGEVVAIQDKQHFYWRERGWFIPGTAVQVFAVDGVKVGLVRGLDMLYPEYTRQLQDAEALFFATMAVDDMMLQFATTRAIENQCYVVMSSFLGPFLKLDFLGNAAVIEPVFAIPGGIKAAHMPRRLQHLAGEGLIRAECDLDDIRKVKRAYPMGAL